MSIVVKCSIGSDLRRFSISRDITMSKLIDILGKLYALDLSKFKIQYRDEEDDLVWLTTDLEVTEAVRHALASTPAILRLYISEQGVTQSVIGKSIVDELASGIQKLRVEENSKREEKPQVAQKKKLEDDWEITPPPGKACPPIQEPLQFNQPTVVYVAGKAYYPSSNPQPRNYGPTKVNPDLKPHQIPQIVNSPLKEVDSSLQFSDTSFHCPTLVSPVVVVVPPPSTQHRSLSALTTSIAESISNVVLESSAFMHKHSCAASDAILRDTLVASQMTREEANSSELQRASSETRLVTNRETENASSSVLWNSEAANVAVSPISAQTRSLQDEATKGLNDLLNIGSDAILNEILNL